MSMKEQTNAEKKSSLLSYVGRFIEKRDNQLRESDDEASLTYSFDGDSVVINSGEDDFSRPNLDKRPSGSTDIDADELSLLSDPVVETHEGGEQTYKQQVYLRQYQPPTPEPIDIQVQEIILKPQVQRPPIHVYVKPKKTDRQRTPSPILIKSAPPQPTLPPSNGPVVYNKYIPVTHKTTQQVIIHRYPELPPKPRPIIVDQWLPNKPAAKRITYRRVNRDEFLRSEKKRNRYIEYKKPHTTIELEIIRLPVIKLSPQEYQNRSDEMARLYHTQSLKQDPNTLQWRI